MNDEIESTDFGNLGVVSLMIKGVQRIGIAN